jgi:hypothetical protein
VGDRVLLTAGESWMGLLALTKNLGALVPC